MLRPMLWQLVLSARQHKGALLSNSLDGQLLEEDLSLFVCEGSHAAWVPLHAAGRTNATVVSFVGVSLQPRDESAVAVNDGGGGHQEAHVYYTKTPDTAKIPHGLICLQASKQQDWRLIWGPGGQPCQWPSSVTPVPPAPGSS